MDSNTSGLVPIYWTTRRHIPEDRSRRIYRRTILKSEKVHA